MTVEKLVLQDQNPDKVGIAPKETTRILYMDTQINQVQAWEVNGQLYLTKEEAEEAIKSYRVKDECTPHNLVVGNQYYILSSLYNRKKKYITRVWFLGESYDEVIDFDENGKYTSKINSLKFVDEFEEEFEVLAKYSVNKVKEKLEDFLYE